MPLISALKMTALEQWNDQRPVQSSRVPIRWRTKLVKIALGTICAVVVVASLAVVSPANAQRGGVFGNSSITMDPGDWDKLKGSVRAVLEEYRVGSRQAWKSDSTDRAGEAFLTETFERNGLKCAQVTHRFTAGQEGRTYTAPLSKLPTAVGN